MGAWWAEILAALCQGVAGLADLFSFGTLWVREEATLGVFKCIGRERTQTAGEAREHGLDRFQMSCGPY